MKQHLLRVVWLVFGLVFAGSAVMAQPPIIETEKSMYNLDPYYWVYSASLYEVRGENQNLWPMDGHDVSISFSLSGYTGTSSLTFEVEGLSDTLGGLMEEDLQEPGLFRGTFVVDEAGVGGELFKPGEKDQQGNALVPKAVTLTISDADGIVASRQVHISRWGCDRCHLAQDVAREVYPWCSPAGGPRGPHTWPNVLGRNGGRPGFDYNNLTDVALTHTPTVGGYVTDRSSGEQVWVDNSLNRPPYHQRTNPKMPASAFCTPCHQGSGHVRSAYKQPDMDWRVSKEQSLTVKCVFCHGVSGGYVPEDPQPLWENWIIEGWN